MQTRDGGRYSIQEGQLANKKNSMVKIKYHEGLLNERGASAPSPLFLLPMLKTINYHSLEKSSMKNIFLVL